ncbi:MAG: hypothetical protein ACN6O3_12500 [Comamonas sp.]
MADMVDCGRHVFKSWAAQVPSPATGECRENRALGPFDPSMTAERACALYLEGKVTKNAEAAFKRGWNAAQAEYNTQRAQAQKGQQQ